MTCSTNAYGITADFRLHNKAVKGWEFSKVRDVGRPSSHHHSSARMLKAEVLHAVHAGYGVGGICL